MDCEKFDQILIDALYDELDELTLAAAKRHADGCRRCQTAWSGLKATRKVGILPIVQAPDSLEGRVIAQAREAHRNISWPRRVGRAITWAGAFAMRPQTAMAALLLLMLASSLLFVKPKPDRGGALNRVRVTERGVPEQAPDDLRLGNRTMAEGQGAIPVPPLPAGSPLARRDEERAKGADLPSGAAAPPATGAAGRSASGALAPTEGEQTAPPTGPRTARAAEPEEADDFAEPPSVRAQTADPYRASDASEAQPLGAQGGAAPAAPMALGDVDRKAEAVGPAGAPRNEAYAAAMALYSEERFAEAEKAFGAAAASGGKNAPYAALWAAKSAEAHLGCGSAAAKYESVASRHGGSSAGAEALWGAASCYKTLGAVDKARSLYMTLRSVAGYRDRAEAELANLALVPQTPAARAGSRATARPAAPPPR